jgi:hypothetical protein
MNLAQAFSLVSCGAFVDARDGSIHAPGFQKRVVSFFNRQYRHACKERVTACALGALEKISRETPVEERVMSFKLAEAVVTRYQASQSQQDSIARLDRFIVEKRKELWPGLEVESDEFRLTFHRELLEKWIGYGFSADFYLNHFDCAKYLLQSKIASAMALWGDAPQLIDGNPYIRCNGQFVEWNEVASTLKIQHHRESLSCRYYDTENKPMEYLGGGQGLVLCDRYEFDALPVAARVDAAETAFIQKLSKEYRRPSEQTIPPTSEVACTRDYVLQVVTPENKTGASPFAQTFKKTGHPYLRLISPNGEVKIVGFMKFNNNWNLLNHGQGSLNSPDFGEYCYSGVHLITNIPLDQNEAEKFEEICLSLQRDNGLAFNYRSQNCTSFVKYVLEEIELAEFPKSPSSLRLFSHLITGNGQLESENHTENKKTFLRTVKKAAGIVLTLLLKPFALILGDRPFNKFGAKPSYSQGRPVFQFFKWLVEPITIDYPMQIQAWQKKMVSTERVVKEKRAVFSSSRSDLGFRSKKQASIPGFGTPVIRVDSKPTVVRIWRAVKGPLAFIGATAIVAAAAGAILLSHVWVPVAIASCAVLALYGLSALAYKIYQVACKRLSQTTLHPEMIRHNQQRGPQVGERSMCDVQVINCVDDSYALKLNLLKSAQQSIDITFNFAGGSHYDVVLDIIEEKLQMYPDFKVHLIMSEDLLSEEQVLRMQKINEQFSSRFHYLVTDRQFLMDGMMRTEENHAKAMVIDGKYFVVGGSGIHEKMNKEHHTDDQESSSFAESFIDQSFRDTDLFGSGELAHTIRGQIYNLYQIWSARMGRDLQMGEGVYSELDLSKSGSCSAFDSDARVIRNVEMNFLVGGPEHRKANPISEAYVREIDKAKEQVKIANLYFNPDKSVVSSIKRAKKERVKTSGFFNGVGKGISVIHYNYILNNHKNYSLLTDVHEYQVPKRCYHKKVMTIDGKVALLGSFNLGQKSAHCDNECVVTIWDDRVVRELDNGIDEDKEFSVSIKSSVTKKERFLLPTQLISRLVSRFGNVMA